MFKHTLVKDIFGTDTDMMKGTLMEYGFLWLGLLNLAGFCAMGMDKHRAAARRWRIPEKTLFGIALLGGSLGCLAGMYLFRHKTRHLSFTLGIPLILLVQAAALLALYPKLNL